MLELTEVSYLLHICNVEYVTEVEKVFLLEEAGMDFQLSKQWKKLSFDA